MLLAFFKGLLAGVLPSLLVIGELLRVIRALNVGSGILYSVRDPLPRRRTPGVDFIRRSAESFEMFRRAATSDVVSIRGASCVAFFMQLEVLERFMQSFFACALSVSVGLGLCS